MELRNRTRYLKQLISFQDTDLIKVVTGIRRCGKSSLLELMEEHLRENGVAAEQIVSMNFESMNRLQCFFALIRVVHLPVRPICGSEDAAPLLCGIP